MMLHLRYFSSLEEMKREKREQREEIAKNTSLEI
jgi:hypothetical protein